jgi:hypothetical protein
MLLGVAEMYYRKIFRLAVKIFTTSSWAYFEHDFAANFGWDGAMSGWVKIFISINNCDEIRYPMPLVKSIYFPDKVDDWERRRKGHGPGWVSYILWPTFGTLMTAGFYYCYRSPVDS